VTITSCSQFALRSSAAISLHCCLATSSVSALASEADAVAYLAEANATFAGIVKQLGQEVIDSLEKT